MLPSIKEYRPNVPLTEGIWASLGLPSRGSQLHDLIRQGLPFDFLDQLASFLRMERKVLCQSMCISPTTLARRAKAGRLTCAESDRLYSLTLVLHAASERFEGDAEAVKRWITSPVRGLGSKTPLEMLGTRVETQAVIDLLGRLENGVAV